MSDNEFANTEQWQESTEGSATSESTTSPALEQEFDAVIQSLHQEFDNVIRTALKDAMNQATEIKAKAEAEAEALLKQARDDRTRLEGEISSLQKERDRLAQTLNESLLNLKRRLQELTAILRQAEEQVEQQLQALQQAGIRAEAPIKPEEKMVEVPEVPEEVTPEYLRPKEEAIVGYEVPEEAVPERKEPEKVEEYGGPAREALEKPAVPEFRQPAVETRLRIIGLRHIGWLHRIEQALADDPFVEDVRTIKYSDNVLVLAVRHQPTSLPGILRRVPGLSVRDVRETGEWIEVYLGEFPEIG